MNYLNFKLSRSSRFVSSLCASHYASRKCISCTEAGDFMEPAAMYELEAPCERETAEPECIGDSAVVEVEGRS